MKVFNSEKECRKELRRLRRDVFSLNDTDLAERHAEIDKVLAQLAPFARERRKRAWEEQANRLGY